MVELTGDGVLAESWPAQYPGVTAARVVSRGDEDDLAPYREALAGLLPEEARDEPPALTLHWEGGSAQASSTALVLARTDELVLQGEYLSQSLVESADGVWALVGDGRAELEYLPMDEQEYVSLLLSGEEMTSRFAFADGVPEGVRAGDYAAVVVKTDQRQDVLWLPPGALCRDAAGEYVYIPGENGGKVRQDVKTGARTTTAVEITQGLSGGDVVYVQ